MAANPTGAVSSLAHVCQACASWNVSCSFCLACIRWCSIASELTFFCAQEIKSEGLHNEVSQILNGYKQVKKQRGFFVVVVSVCVCCMQETDGDLSFLLDARSCRLGTVHVHPGTSSGAEISEIRGLTALRDPCHRFSLYHHHRSRTSEKEGRA